MTEQSSHDEAQRISDRAAAKRNADRKNVADRNEQARKAAKKRRQAFEELKADLRARTDSRG
jgi:hypothetical protein